MAAKSLTQVECSLVGKYKQSSNGPYNLSWDGSLICQWEYVVCSPHARGLSRLNNSYSHGWRAAKCNPDTQQNHGELDHLRSRRRRREATARARVRVTVAIQFKVVTKLCVVSSLLSGAYSDRRASKKPDKLEKRDT